MILAMFVCSFSCVLVILLHYGITNYNTRIFWKKIKNFLQKNRGTADPTKLCPYSLVKSTGKEYAKHAIEGAQAVEEYLFPKR
jgi:hypothetical protein